MERGLKWKIPFRSQDGRQYSIGIYAEGHSGEAATLTGADTPIETSEAAADDFFAPVRTQTGYLRIVDDGETWRELIPDSHLQHQVRLTDDAGTVRWIGYMKAEAYTTQAFRGTAVYEFPVVCPLGLLSVLPLSFSYADYGGTLLTVGQMLHLALKATDVEWGQVYFPGEVSDWEDLNARLSLTNFTDVRPEVASAEADPVWTDTKSMSEMFETLCRFWGWSAVCHGTDVYFTAGDEDSRVRVVSFRQLAGIVDADAGFTPETQRLDGLEFMSDNHYEEIRPGRRHVVLTASVNEGNTLIEPDLAELDYELVEYEGKEVSSVENVQNGKKYYFVEFHLKNPSDHYEYGKYVYRILSERSPASLILMKDIWEANDEGKTGISLKKYIQLAATGERPDGGLSSLFTARTYGDVAIPAGSQIFVTADVSTDFLPVSGKDIEYPNSYFYVSLKCGDKYLHYINSRNPISWESGEVYMCMYLGTSAGVKTKESKIKFNPGLSTGRVMVYDGVDGAYFNMPESIYGRLEVGVRAEPSQDMMVSNLKVSIVPPDSLVFPKAKAENEYRRTAGLSFPDDEEVDLGLASGGCNKYGTGQMYDAAGNYLTAVATADGRRVPEEMLAERMAAHYARSRRWLTVEVRESWSRWLPSWHYTHQGRRYAIKGIGHNWRDDTMTLTLAETD